MPTVTTFDALLSGYSWNGVSVSGRPAFLAYSFDAEPGAAAAGAFSADFLGSFQAFDALEQAAARQALAAWGDVSGITFLEVGPGQGDIRFGAYNLALGPASFGETVGFAYNPMVFADPDGATETALGGDVFVQVGKATFATLLHEIGHALGLKHPFEGSTILDPSIDNIAHSVLSYSLSDGAPAGLGILDIEAIQFLYGPASADGDQAANWSWDAERAILTQTGGPGEDSLAGVAAADRIHAGAGADYVMGRAGADVIDGEAGDDTLAGGDGDDTINGGVGADVIDGDAGADSLAGGEGDDILWGLAGDDTLSGGPGDDTLRAGSGINRLSGGDGDDVLVISSGAVIADGGDGYDALWLAPAVSAAASLSYADLTKGGGSYSAIESIAMFGGAGGDTLAGGILIDVLVGDAGADLLRGAAANDQLFGGADADTLEGGAGADTLDGGSGDDLILPGPGADDIWGGAGEDTVDFTEEFNGVELTINTQRFVDGGVETMRGVENVTGTDYADIIIGDAGPNRIHGGGGSDVIRGGEGINYLRGDEGADNITGGSDFDDISGNAGDDTASGGGGDDWVVGGRDNDLLSGDGGDDIVYGNLGDDTCEGGEGDDLLRGGQGADVIRGGAGADFLSGDKGDDTLTGGEGADIFHTFGEAGIDRVLDFSLAQGDRVRVEPGTTFTVSQAGSDTVVAVAGGGRMVLVGVALSGLTGDWIFGG